MKVCREGQKETEGGREGGDQRCEGKLKKRPNYDLQLVVIKRHNHHFNQQKTTFRQVLFFCFFGLKKPFILLMPGLPDLL